MNGIKNELEAISNHLIDNLVNHIAQLIGRKSEILSRLENLGIKVIKVWLIDLRKDLEFK